MEVWCKEHWLPGSRSHGVDIKAITCKGRHKDLSINQELGRAAPIPSYHLADFVSLAGVVPVEVEGDEDLCTSLLAAGWMGSKGDEHLHIIIGRRLVGQFQLSIRVRVDTDIQSESVDAQGLCSLHIIVIISSRVAVAGYSNLP
jgi:hypothetical protein